MATTQQQQQQQQQHWLRSADDNSNNTPSSFSLKMDEEDTPNSWFIQICSFQPLLQPFPAANRLGPNYIDSNWLFNNTSTFIQIIFHSYFNASFFFCIFFFLNWLFFSFHCSSNLADFSFKWLLKTGYLTGRLIWLQSDLTFQLIPISMVAV